MASSALRVSLTFALACVLAAAAWSADSAGPAPGLSLGDAERIAFNESPLLALRRAKVDAAFATARLAQAEARRTWRLTETTSASTGQNIDPAYWYSYGDLASEISRTLSDGGKARAESLVASAYAAAAQADYAQQAADLAYGVAEAYYRAVRAEVDAHLAEQTVELLTDHLRRARSRVSEGDAPQLDVLRTETQLAAASADAAEARSALETARRDLAAVLGRPPTTDLGLLAAPDVAVAQPLDGNAVASTALEGSYEIRAKRIEYEIAQAGIAVAEAASKPDWSLAFAYTLGSDRTGARHLVTLGVSYSAPVVDHGARHERESAARAEAEATTHALDAEKSRVETDVRNLVSEIGAAREKLESFAQAERLATVVHQKATVGYAEGAVAMRDLLDAVHDLTSARRDRVAAECELRTRMAELVRYGVPDPTGLVPLPPLERSAR